MVAVRISKIALVVSTSLFYLLVGYNNIVDYNSNFLFVQHVLSMDTTFPENAVRTSRAILDPRIHHAAYWLIIAAELMTGLICLFGSIRLSTFLHASPEEFNGAKTISIFGLAAGMLFWFFCFLVVGGEWFQMWQSSTWNAQNAAFRFLGSSGLILIFLSLEDS